MRKPIVIALLSVFLVSVLATSVTATDPDKSDRRKMIKLCRLYLKQAVALVDSGGYDAALPLLDSVLLCDPKNPDGYYYLGKIHITLGDTALAEEKLSLGVSKAPMSSRLKLLLARVKLWHDEVDASTALVDQVLRINPRHTEGLYLKGLLLTAQADTVSAIEHYRKAIEVWREKGR